MYSQAEKSKGNYFTFVIKFNSILIKLARLTKNNRTFLE